METVTYQGQQFRVIWRGPNKRGPGERVGLVPVGAPRGAQATFVDANQVEGEVGRIEVRQAAVVASRATEADLPEGLCPDGLEFLPFQKAGIAFALARPNVLFGDVPGLGKTIQAIGVFNADPSLRRVLIIAPASLLVNWRREWTKWSTRESRIEILTSAWRASDQDEVCIVNYDIADKLAGELRSRRWDLLILDEMHYLKNADAKRTQAILGAPAKRARGTKGASEAKPAIEARRKLGLTGTPIPNRPIEGWTIFSALAPEVFTNFWGYAKRFCGAYQGKWGWDLTGASHLDELQRKLRESIMIRRLKTEVLTELPPKRRAVVELPANGAADAVRREREAFAAHQERLEALQAAVELAKASDDPEEYERAVRKLAEAHRVAFSEISRVRHETAVAKIPYALAFIHDALDDSEEKLIVWVHHHDLADAVKADLGDQAVVLTGRENREERQAAVDRFQTDPTVRVFIGSIMAAGVGITLTASSRAIFLELDWVPGNVSQAEDRCVLAGQPILTANGWTPVEDVRVGDAVIGSDGLPHTVTDTWNRLARGKGSADSKDIVEVGVRGWLTPLAVTSDHRVLTTRGWVEAGDLRPRDRLVMPASVEGARRASLSVDATYRLPAVVHTPAHQMFGEHHETPRVKPAGEQQNTRLWSLPEALPLTADALFAFGYYMGDGFARIGDRSGRFVSFAGNKTRKRDHLARVQRWLESLGLSGSLYERPAPEQGVELRVFAGELARWVAGEFGRVLDEKRVPEWVYGLAMDQRQAFLEGWLAADGYVRRGRREIVTALKRLAADVARLLMSLGEKPTVQYGDAAHAYTIGWTPGTPPTLVVQRILHRTCDKVERVYDLTVEGVESFVIGTAVVHNCHRIGQTNSVLVQHLVLEGSLDARMAEILVDKQRVLDAALDKREAVTVELGTPLLPLRADERAATETATRDKLAEEGATLSAERVVEIHAKLRILAERCDGARAIDGAGFNKLDTNIGKSLAAAPRLSARQAALGARLVRKYRRQLGG